MSPTNYYFNWSQHVWVCKSLVPEISEKLLSSFLGQSYSFWHRIVGCVDSKHLNTYVHAVFWTLVSAQGEGGPTGSPLKILSQKKLIIIIIIIIIIVINGTYKAQNLPKNSGRTKNKQKKKTKQNKTKNKKQGLWIRKGLTEQMHFQMSLELQEISDVTKTAWKRVPNSRGSKMKWAFTGWLKVNPGNFEQFFRR